MRKPLLIVAAAAAAAFFAISGSDSEIEAFPPYGMPQHGWGAQQQAWGNAQMTAQDAMLLQSLMMNAGANTGTGLQQVPLEQGNVQRDNFWFSRVGAGNYDPVSGAGYVSVPGHGPIGFGM